MINSERQEESTLSCSDKEKGEESVNNLPSQTEVEVDNSTSDIQFEEDTENERDKILIIDSIQGAKRFTDSKFIFQEVKRYSERTKVVFAYSLAKGGVAIHLETKQDRDNLLNILPEEAFGHGIKKKLEHKKKEIVFLKDVDTRVSVKEISKKLEEKQIKVEEIERLSNSVTSRPSRTVKLVTDQESLEKLSQTKILCQDKEIRIWKMLH